MNNIIIENQALPVNEDFNETVERCSQDEGYHFSIISNSLIRDVTLSPECRWLIIYLLSNKEGWKINVQQVINHLKPHMGKDKVYSLFNEAIEKGYIKREEISRKNPKGGMLKGYRYLVSESPKFKKILRHPENQDTGGQHPGFADSNKYYRDKKDYIKDNISSLKVPEKENAAKAAEAEVKPPSKSIKEKPPFDPKVHEVVTAMLAALNRTKPDYVPPRILNSMLTEVDFLLRLDKRDPVKLMDVFNWALSDSFWADKMFKPNPAKYLRTQFDQLEMRMNAKPEQSKKERKFAPCSNQNNAKAAMEEMNKRAL